MKLTITNDDGTIDEIAGVITFDYWDRDGIRCVVNAFCDTSHLSDRGYEEFLTLVVNEVVRFHENYPSVEDVRLIALNVLKNYTFETDNEYHNRIRTSIKGNQNEN